VNKKQFLVFQAWLSIAAICFFIAFLLLQKVEPYGYAMGILLIGYFVYKAFKDFKRSATISEEETVSGLPVNATDSQQIRYYKRAILIGAIAFPAFTIINIYSIHSLESGTEQTIELWGPISFIYTNAGYWPAVLSVPLVGTLCILVLLKKISVLKSKF
jgi:hypothetical protein